MELTLICHVRRIQHTWFLVNLVNKMRKVKFYLCAFNSDGKYFLKCKHCGVGFINVKYMLSTSLQKYCRCTLCENDSKSNLRKYVVVEKLETYNIHG